MYHAAYTIPFTCFDTQPLDGVVPILLFRLIQLTWISSLNIVITPSRSSHLFAAQFLQQRALCTLPPFLFSRIILHRFFSFAIR